MGDFTPTTAQVRDGYAYDPDYRDPLNAGYHASERAFDRWLAAHEAALREQIAAEIEACLPEVGPQINVTPYRDGLWTAYTIAAAIARTPKENPDA